MSGPAPYYEESGITIYHGDCSETLKQLPEASVQACVTSPPYWGLRDYGTGTWEGGSSDCSHVAPPTGGLTKGSGLAGTGNRKGFSSDGQYRDVCGKCGATRIDRQIGLEKTPEEYVAKMVEVFREVRRVLKDDGTLWLNLGDCYCSIGHKKSHSGYGTTGLAGGIAQEHHPVRRENDASSIGLKHKDLVGIPWRVAFALQADGWYLRSDIIWHKPNPMPESVTDRPTKSHEYIFLLSKSERYYYDADAIKEPGEMKPQRRFTNGKGPKANGYAAHRQPTGMTECEFRNKRSVWTVATQPYSEAHFATFPPKLIEPCVLAGAPAGGVVLDPFHGAGTTGMVAKQLGRRYVGCELNQAYIQLSLKRFAQEVLCF